jgi:hypothetical protein
MQKIVVNYYDEVESFPIHERLSGIISANVYCGFDQVIDKSGLTFKLNHELTGQLFTDINLNQSPRQGAWVTKQGTAVKEDAPIPLAIETNAGNSKQRTDYLIGRHHHDVLIEQGVAATYEIIKGPMENERGLPNIPQPETATILGRFVMPATSGTLANLIWIRNRTPNLGGKYPALLEEENRFSEAVYLNQGTDITGQSLNFELPNRGVILGLTKGNVFVLGGGIATLDLIEDKPNGTEIKIYVSAPLTIRNFTAQLVGGITGAGTRAGYTYGMRAIVLSDTVASYIEVRKHQIITLVKMDSGRTVFTPNDNDDIAYGDFWKLVSIGDSSERIQDLEAAIIQKGNDITNLTTLFNNLALLVSNINPPRSILQVDLPENEYTANFDATGKARSTSKYYGYAECNGLNGTSDFGGKTLMPRMGSGTAPIEHRTLQGAGGALNYTIARTNLPAVGLEVDYYWKNLRGSQESANIGSMTTIKPELPNDQGYNKTGITRNMGDGVAMKIEGPFITTLTLMWIGIPSL